MACGDALVALRKLVVCFGGGGGGVVVLVDGRGRSLRIDGDGVGGKKNGSEGTVILNSLQTCWARMRSA